MTTAVQRRRGTNTEHATFTGLDGEITVNTTTYTLHVHDGATVGGIVLAKADGSNIVTSSIDINGGTIDGTVIGGSSAAAGTFTTISASGEIAANGGVALPDGGQATFGAGDDLKIYHTGSHSYIDENGTGNLYIGSNNGGGVYIQGSGENLATFTDDGAVTLYYDNAEKLATTATGIDVTGTVTADGLDIATGIDTSGIVINTPYGIAGEQYAAIRWNNTSFAGGDSEIRNVVNGASSVGSSLEFFTEQTGTGVLTERLKLHNNGDVSLFEDTGTTAKFYWDASAESLGIGTGSPAANLEVSSATGVSPITPTAIRISSSSSGSGWDLDSPWASLEFYSNDGSGDGAGVKAQISSVMQNSDTGAQAGLAFYTEFSTEGLTEKVRISPEGNVGIGTSPAELLHVHEDSTNVARIRLSNTDGYLEIGTNNQVSNLDSQTHTFRNEAGSTEYMRIDSSGNLLVGTTSTTTSTTGFKWRADLDRLITVADGSSSASFGRLTSDGQIVLFQKDGTTVGSVGTISSGDIYLADNRDSGIKFDGGNNQILPCTSAGAANDATQDLGSSASRFKNLYLSGGVYLGGTGAANHLDDYETGTWSPVYIPSGGSFTSITMDTPDCQYIKIGNMVTVSGIIRTDEVTIGAATGNVLISGLPFTANGWGACSIGRAQDFAGDVPMAGYVGGNSSNINLYYRTAANGSTTALSISDLQTGTVANANYIFIECTYYTTA